ISIGDSYEEVNEAFNFEDEIEYKDDLSFYKFLMSDEDLRTNPLVKVSDDVFVSAYFDTFTDELSSVRMMTGDTLLQLRIYEIEYKDDLSFYKFLMSDEDLRTNPLVKVSDDVFVSAYFDTFTDELSSVRMMTGDTLLQQRIYEIEYRGSLPDPIELSDDEWEK